MKKYFVRFLNGEQDWTSETLMVSEDLKTGNVVYVNRKGRGQYHKGKIKDLRCSP